MPIGALGRVAVYGLREGSDLIEGAVTLSRQANFDYALITCIGSLKETVLGFYDGDTRSYKQLEIKKHVELVSLSGLLSKDESGMPNLHIHAVVSDSEFRCYAGHLIRGKVGYLVELYLTEISGTEVVKVKDPSTGLTHIRNE
ncbi:MAG: DUF296 domain-containing protein [Candidatus Marsarchaeota archaeon]|nr:DUF296 domain-containing protein [Candidatus Marsarchaeota archaeon]